MIKQTNIRIKAKQTRKCSEQSSRAFDSQTAYGEKHNTAREMLSLVKTCHISAHCINSELKYAVCVR